MFTKTRTVSSISCCQFKAVPRNSTCRSSMGIPTPLALVCPWGPSGKRHPTTPGLVLLSGASGRWAAHPGSAHLSSCTRRVMHPSVTDWLHRNTVCTLSVAKEHNIQMRATGNRLLPPLLKPRPVVAVLRKATLVKSLAPSTPSGACDND